MKLLTSLLLMLLYSSIAFGQDQLTLVNNTTIEVKVISENASQLEVKKYNNLNGNSIFIPKSSVHKIVYEDSKTKIFNAIDETEVVKKKANVSNKKGVGNKVVSSEVLMIKRGFWSTSYYKGGNKISCENFEEELATNRENIELYKKGKGQQTNANILAFASGYLLGDGISALIWSNQNTILGPGKTKTYLTLGLGFVGTLISFNFEEKGRSKMLSAIRKHNGQSSLGLRIRGTDSGLGLVLSF